MKTSFIKRLHRAFFISLTLLIIMALTTFIAIRAANRHAEHVLHTQKVIEELEHLISLMKDAETGVRGYIITSDPITLQPYNGSYQKVLESLDKIKALTKDNQQQQKSFPLLRRRIDQKHRFLEIQIELKDQNKPVNPDRILKEGKPVMDEVRVIVKAMQDREQALLKSRSGTWRIFSNVTPFLIILITLISTITSYKFCSSLKKTYFKKVKLQQLLQRRGIETRQRIAIVENVADKIAGGNYHIRLQEQDSDTLGNLAISLNRMAISLENSFNELKALMAKKDDFIGIAAHELKTPLTSIKAYLQYMAKIRLENADSHKIYPFITKANTQVNRLTEIIKDLLDVARINENQLGLKLEKFAIRDAIIEASEELFSSIKTHELLLEGDPNVVVEADKFRIEQVLINLISNAIKYSPNSNKVVLETKVENSTVKVSVTDFGIGIPRENIQFIFQRYFRVEVTSQNYSGMGLGLYISKGIVERHGGEMGVFSKEGAGSTFWFTLPFKQNGTPA